MTKSDTDKLKQDALQLSQATDSDSTLQTDPEASAEQDKYENPIPSRTYILQVMESLEGKASYNQLREHFQLTDDDALEALNRRLTAMVRDNQLVRLKADRYSIRMGGRFVEGKVQANREGFGFVISEDGGEDLFIPARQMHQVWHGDTVRAEVISVDRRGRLEGVIDTVLARNVTQVVGQFVEEKGIAYVVPENSKLAHQVIIDDLNDIKPAHGEYVTVEITEHPTRFKKPRGKLIEVVGELSDPGVEIEVAIREFDIPHEWPKAVLKEAKQYREDVAEEDKLKRVDLRTLPLVTIDGEDAKDFDDAVYCEKQEAGGWRLYVAIADVSHYVAVNSALDKEGLNRGNSVYFPGRVVPMLPEVLSNGLCSLNPKVDRLCMVCEMTISPAGKMSDFKFYEAVMHSHARLTYNKVHDILLGEENKSRKNLCKKYAEVVPHLQDLYELYLALRKQREIRGAIDFDTVETMFDFDENQKLRALIPVKRNEAHKIIEECMLSANVAAAAFLKKHELPGLYRVHEPPQELRLSNLRAYLAELSLTLGGGDEPSPQDYQTLANQIQGRPDQHVLQSMILRSMSQAVYDTQNAGHFGLAFDAYTHFTSPIRRYPDLMVHRYIRHIVRSEKASVHVTRVEGAGVIAKAKIYPYDQEQLNAIGESTSRTERRADEATWDVSAWMKCFYLQQHVGEQFEGVITTITSFGFFVELKDLFVEGLVHISTLPKDYYEADVPKQRMVGSRSGRRFAIGETVAVTVASVVPQTRKIDFVLTEVGIGAYDSNNTKQTPSSRKPRRKLTENGNGKEPGSEGKGKRKGPKMQKGGSTTGTAKKKSQPRKRKK